MARTRELRRRIRSIQNIRKITHAMELVAGAKMRRAQSVVLGTRRYAELAWELLAEVQRRSDVLRHPLLAGRHPIRRSALLVVSGNRGLVGAFHERVVDRAMTLIARESSAPLVVTTGKVARDALHRRGVRIEADFPKKDLLVAADDATSIAQFLLTGFLREEVDQVSMVYVDFRSVMRQEVQSRVLLPVGGVDPFLGQVSEERPTALPLKGGGSVEYLFEPSPIRVLEAVIPNLLAIQVTQALLETTASEHAARMVTMRNATENADEMQDDLVLAFNDARKSSITQEILEIVSGQWSVVR
jgi:F-type H+-transporting ATPase subunit gamma